MSVIFQDVITERQEIATPGMFAEAFDSRRVTSKVARGLIRAGRGVFRVPGSGSGTPNMVSPGLCFQNPSPDLAASDDAILLDHPTSLTETTISIFNGPTGGAGMQPARTVTLTTSASADFDATNWTLSGVDETGSAISETLAVADGGGATVSSANKYARVTALVQPAQAGTGGTFTLGVASGTAAPLALVDFLGVAVRQPIKSGIFANNLSGVTDARAPAHYVDSEAVPVLTTGAIWVFTEEAVADQDPIYVRVTAGAGGSQLGAFRKSAEAGAVLIPNGRFTRDCPAGLASLRFSLV